MQQQETDRQTNSQCVGHHTVGVYFGTAPVSTSHRPTLLKRHTQTDPHVGTANRLCGKLKYERLTELFGRCAAATQSDFC